MRQPGYSEAVFDQSLSSFAGAVGPVAWERTRTRDQTRVIEPVDDSLML